MVITFIEKHRSYWWISNFHSLKEELVSRIAWRVRERQLTEFQAVLSERVFLGNEM